MDGWKIALLVVGAVFVVLDILFILACLRLSKKDEPDPPSGVGQLHEGDGRQ